MMRKILIVIVLLLVVSAVWEFAQKRFNIETTNITNSSTVTIDNVVYKVILADTEELRNQGLSGKKSLLPNEGMLFIFTQKDKYVFWMKDMLFPLDFVWIDDNTIVDMHQNVPIPLTNTYPERVTPKIPVNRVLEINAGEIKKNNFKIGNKVTYSLFKPQ
jgi:uncharacterized protein